VNAQLWRGVQEVKLMGKAFAVLRYLVGHPGQLATKDDLFAAAWPETVVSEATLVSCIQELRQALRDDAKKPRYIETAHRRGYRFVAAVAAPVPSPEFRVLSQEERSSIQQEESQTPALNPSTPLRTSVAEGANGENALESSVQGLESIIPSLPLDDVQLPDPRRSMRDSAAPTRSWRYQRFAPTAVVVLLGAILTVYYVIRPHFPPGLLPEKPSLAILPFANLSGDPSQEYFSDGVTEEITARLARVSSLFVIARTSAFTYKGKGAKVQDISRELGVRYVVEGSVRKTEEQVRVIAQLIDAASGAHLWAEHYNRPLKDIFAVQDEIVQAVVTALKVKLTPEEQKIFSYAPTESLEAYDYMLRGWQSHLSWTPEVGVHAQQMFEKAIELDPRYALAYASLAVTYIIEWQFQQNQDPQIRERAFTLAHKAIALDDSSPGVHEVLGLLYLWIDKQHDQAIAEGERSVALGPNCPSCHCTLGLTLIQAGRPADAIAFIEKGLQLDPLSRMRGVCLTSLGQAYLMMGRYEEALSPLRKALGFLDAWNTHLQLAVTYSVLGREQEARAEVAEVVRTNPQMSLEALRRMSVQKDPARLERFLAALRKAGMK
jgi:TolB-like protein/DNA-binding winged helix-turn-helix (wHTH) protein/Tfp pilus assembly protein PilF